MNPTLFALALSAFTLGLSEFMPMGHLPVMAEDLGVYVPKAGMLVTAYAFGVMIVSPMATLILLPLSRKKALILLLTIFTAGSVFSAVAPGYGFLVLSRIIMSFAHGSFFGIGAVLAMEATPKEKRAGAVSLMFTGFAVANIGGVPAAAWLGEIAGWRTAFAAAAGLGAAALITFVIFVPAGGKGTGANVVKEMKALIDPSVIRVFFGTVMFSSSLFTL